MIKIYNKLVRDKIPEICRKDGARPKYYALSQSKFKQALKKKLVEESKELTQAKKSELLNEIVDVYEILLSLVKAYGLKWRAVEKLRLAKNKKRGSFKKRYFLVNTKK